MPRPASPTPARHHSTQTPWGSLLAAATMGIVVILAVGLPVVGVGVQLASSHPDPSAHHETTPWSWGAVFDTIIYTGSIAVLATALALPAAWVIRRRSALWTALIGLPLLMPTYLAYAGWGLLRGPGSWLGDWLGHAAPWVSTAFDRCLAVAGLSLWAWPIGAFVIGAAARRIPVHLLDALDLEPGPRWRKGRVVLGMLGGSIGASIVLIALVMAGSAIPLHLAQADTYAIHLWKYMSLTTEPASVWRAATPLVGVAMVGAWAISRAMGRERVGIADDGDAPNRRMSRTVRGLAIGIWGLSVIAPGVLFAGHIRHWSPFEAASVPNFWRQNMPAVGFSAEVAAIVAGMITIIALAMYALRCTARRGVGGLAARVGLWALLASAILPGVLVGSATLAFWNAGFIPRAAGDSIWPVVLAHTARFGFLGAMAGWWLASLETPDERGARLMVAGDGLRGWAAICLRPHVGAVVGIALAAAALSLHEIESTVIVQPPGPTSLAQYVLDKLHYNRNEDLCAASVNLFVVGLVLAGGAGWLIGRARKTPLH